MMGRRDRDQRQLFYEFSLDEMIPRDHLLRRINVFATAVLADLHQQLKAFYSDIGRPSSSTSPPSCRTSRRWRCVYWVRQLVECARRLRKWHGNPVVVFGG
jgi:hypothetical protein